MLFKVLRRSNAAASNELKGVWRATLPPKKCTINSNRQTTALYSTSHDNPTGGNSGTSDQKHTEHQDHRGELLKTKTTQSQYDLVSTTTSDGAGSVDTNIYDTLRSILDGPVQSFTSFFAVQNDNDTRRPDENRKESGKGGGGKVAYDYQRDKPYGGIDVSDDILPENDRIEDEGSMSSSLYNVLYQYVPSLSRSSGGAEVITTTSQPVKPKVLYTAIRM